MHGERMPARRFRRGTAPLSDANEAVSADLGFEISTGSDRMADPSLEAAYDPSVPVPIPTEIPPPPNLASLPARVLHSGTVETLIGQNEDLMARLKINLRRNALLEQKILELERELHETRQENSSLQDQYYIVQEKDRIYKAKSLELDERFDELKASNELLRTQLEEITITSTVKIRALESYVRRVRRWARPSMDKARGRLESGRLRTIELVHHIESLRKEIAERDFALADLQRRFDDLSRFEREREHGFQKDQARLAESYEKKMAGQADLIVRMEADLSFFKERAQMMEESTRLRVIAENEAIRLGRKNEELEKKLNSEVLDLQTQAATYRGEAKALAAEVESMREQIAKDRSERERLDAANSKLNDQLESLHILWAEGRRHTESLELRLESLNRINQELSRKLREQRTQMETQSLELKPASPVPVRAAPEDLSGSMRKIDSLLATIESGFPMARSSEAAKIRDLEILDDPPLRKEDQTDQEV